MKASVLNRKLHRWGAILTALPVLVVVATGLLLLLKKDVDWIQPATRRGTEGDPRLSFEQVLEAARGAEEAGIRSWDDVDRLDVRPDKGVVKVRGRNRMEVQIDLVNGAVLQVAERRSDLIESIHDGSFFHEHAKLWVFLPSGLILLGLWFSGLWLWFLPHVRRRSARTRTS